MILHQLRLARPADAADIADLTASTRTDIARWVKCAEHGAPASNCLDMALDPDPSTDECEAIRRRLVTVDDADEAHLLEIEAAIADPETSAGVRLLLKIELARYGEQPPTIPPTD